MDKIGKSINFATIISNAYYGIHQRISQTMDGKNKPVDSIMEQAAYIVRRSKETAGTLEFTESYKRGQIEELISFADGQDLWIHFDLPSVVFLDRGLYGIDGDLYFIDTQIRNIR